MSGITLEHVGDGAVFRIGSLRLPSGRSIPVSLSHEDYAAVEAALAGRCWSCDHSAAMHHPEGCRYAVSTGDPGANLVCPCDQTRESAGFPCACGHPHDDHTQGVACDHCACKDYHIGGRL